MSTRLVIILPAGGLPPARTLITDFVLSLFSGLDMLYIDIIFIYTYIYIQILTYTYNDYISIEYIDARRNVRSA